jgi:hypothetical protein
MEGVRVGVALYVDILVEARLPVDCGFFALGDVWAAEDIVCGKFVVVVVVVAVYFGGAGAGKRNVIGMNVEAQTPKQVLGR